MTDVDYEDETHPPSAVNADQQAPLQEPRGRVLGIFGLSSYTRQADLDDLYRPYGSLERVDLIFDKQTGRSKGFAFVYFQEAADAQVALLRTNGMDLHGRAIRVDYSKTDRPHEATPGEYRGVRRLTRRYDDYDNRYSRRWDGGDDRGRMRSPELRRRFNDYDDRHYRAPDRRERDRGGYDRPYRRHSRSRSRPRSRSKSRSRSPNERRR